MPEYTMNDVQMMLRASKKLNGMQEDIRQFLALAHTLLNKFLGRPEEIVVHFKMHGQLAHGCFFIRRFPIHNTRTMHWEKVVYITVSYMSISHTVWDGKFHALPEILVEPVWRNLPSLLNAVNSASSETQLYLEFLQRVESR